jgi:superfamily II DNA or RNA helicase
VALTLSSAASVRARIAQYWFDASNDSRSLGRFTLRESQRETVARLERLLRHDGGALLADPPGTGKTVIALAVAARLNVSPLVAAPAALRAHWHRAAHDAGLRIAFVSLESLGRGAVPAPRALLIVDEAHHLRTRGTRRYARVAALASAAKVLLLSATPVVNRADDRDALLALFSEPLANGVHATRVIVRGTRDRDTGPAVLRLPTLRGHPEVPGLRSALDRLPPPFPAANGRTALPLVRVTLAMAWRSSLAALDETLRRRVQRGISLADALAAGRWPTRETLRQWLVGDDATQLALDFVLDSSDAAPPPRALGLLRAHLDALQAMRTRIARDLERDSQARAAAIEALARAHAGERVVVFAQYAATIRALWHHLRRSNGVVAITGDRVRAAAGRWSRAEVLGALGPGAAPLRDDDPRAIRILLTTDLLSEGVELQGVGIVVHGDVPWTPARIAQRVGRAARAGNTATSVRVTHFAPPRGVRGLLSLAARLAAKRNASTQALREPERRQRLSALFGTWRGDVLGAPKVAIAAAVESDRPQFIAAIAPAASGGSLVVGRCVRGRWQMSRSASAILRVAVRALGPERGMDPVGSAHAAELVRRWIDAQRARTAMGRVGTGAAALWRRVHRRIERALEGVALRERATLARRCTVALDRLAAASGVGARNRVAALLKATGDDRTLIDALAELATAWQELEPPGNGSGAREPESAPRLMALLLLGHSRSGG